MNAMNQSHEERTYQRVLQKTERSGIPNRRYVEFGRRMAQAVREDGIAETNDALGKALGFAQVTVGAWLRGDKLPPIDRGVKIAMKCGVCVEWLYTGNGPKYPQPDHPVIRMAQALATLSPEMQDTVRMMIAAAN